MDILSNQNGSPRITGLDDLPPSTQSDLESHQPPFPRVSIFDIALVPSYDNEQNISSSHFEDAGNIELGLRPYYDPAEFDASPFAALLMFDADAMPFYSGPFTSSIDFPQCGDAYYMPHYYSSSTSGSDALSNAPEGSNSSGNDDHYDKHSRASSVPPNNADLYTASPRLNVLPSLETITSHSPNLETVPLPRVSLAPIPEEPTSPAHVLMHDDHPVDTQAPPKIDESGGEGEARGPQIDDIPESPISGGGTMGTSVPSQSTSETLHQGPLHGVDQRPTKAMGRQLPSSVHPDQEFTFR